MTACYDLKQCRTQRRSRSNAEGELDYAEYCDLKVYAVGYRMAVMRKDDNDWCDVYHSPSVTVVPKD